MLGIAVRRSGGRLLSEGAGNAAADLADVQQAPLVVQVQPHLVVGGRVAVLEHVGACLAQGDLDVVGAVGIDAHDQHAGAHHVAGDRTER